MTKRKRVCRLCRRPDNICGPISTRQLCAECARGRMLENAAQQRARAGPYYELAQQRWRQSMGRFGRPETPYPPDA